MSGMDRVRSWATAGFVAALSAGAASPPISLDVVYPRLEGRNTTITLPRVDSTFAFGSIQPPDGRLYVNGEAARVWENGAFLAYVPLDTVNRQFRFLLVSPEGDSVEQNLDFAFLTAEDSVHKFAPAHPLNQRLPARITVMQPHAQVRATPGGAYILAPLPGSQALADSFIAPSYRVRLHENLHGWIEDRYVQLDTTDRTAPRAIIGRVKVHSNERWTRVEIPLDQPPLFRLEHRPEDRALVLDLFGAGSRINRIDYDPADPLIQEIRWAQIQDDLLRLEIILKSSRLWGYGALWRELDGIGDGSTLEINVRHAPRLEKRVLKNRRIVLDPGHGGQQPGSIGPTRLLEKEPNLKLAIMLKALLEKEGAVVFLTRSADSTVELYRRADYAVQQDGEILVSLHNNALSDGENPFVKRGSAAYYYHSQSLDLARVLHDDLLPATGLPDHGWYYQNLALARPTEMLAVLLECAFMIHPEEEMLLRDDRFLKRTARGIAEGLKEFLEDCRDER
jgi:N-acetylmuramoyl-L-alanine amidase